jgi:hypothetical protein
MMKTKYINNLYIFGLALAAFTFNSCDDFEQFEPLGENSIEDETPPNALFSYSQGVGLDDEWKTYTFSNQSASATTYAWDFGDGNTGDGLDEENTYPGEGTFTVTLTASDALGQMSTYSEEITIVEPEAPAAIIPPILESSFEDNSLPDGTGDGRDSWRNSDLGGVIQITSSPVYEGSQASKFPSGGDRIAYQELMVTPNSDYILSYFYTLKTNNPGSITVSVIAGGGHTDLTAALAATIEDFEGTDQSSSSTYVPVSISFNSGANDTVSILVTNQGEEARIDSFSIALGD